MLKKCCKIFSRHSGGWRLARGVWAAVCAARGGGGRRDLRDTARCPWAQPGRPPCPAPATSQCPASGRAARSQPQHCKLCHVLQIWANSLTHSTKRRTLPIIKEEDPLPNAVKLLWDELIITEKDFANLTKQAFLMVWFAKIFEILYFFLLSEVV